MFEDRNVRIKIQSTDRIGISQEILAIFAKQAWNLKAVEVSTEFTFVHIEHLALSLEEINQCLKSVEGIISIKEVTLLPIEQRENHLQTLLDRIPDPIIDIDYKGTILAINSATRKLIETNNTSKVIILLQYKNQNLMNWVKFPINRFSISRKTRRI